MSESSASLPLPSSASDSSEAAVRKAAAVALRSELLVDDVEGAARALEVTLEEIAELRPKFSIVLDMPKLWRMRSALEAICVLELHVTGGPEVLGARLRQAAETLSRMAGDDKPMDVNQQAELCHVAWTLCVLLEGVKAESASTAGAAALALASLCTSGPPALRPALMPCVGFLLRSHGQLLFVHPVLHEVLRAGLASGSRALRKRSLETLDWALSTEQDSTVAVRLAELQADAVLLLGDRAPSIAKTALSVVRSLFKLGSLDVASALPRLLAVILAGRPELVSPAGGLLLELAAARPSSLIEALAAGVRLAAEHLGNSESFGEVCEEWHRFEIVREACQKEEVGAYGREVVRLLCGYASRLGASFACQGYQGGLLFCLLEGPARLGDDLSAELAEALRGVCLAVSDASCCDCSALLAFPPLASLCERPGAATEGAPAVTDVVADLVEVGPDSPALHGVLASWLGEGPLQKLLTPAPKAEAQAVEGFEDAASNSRSSSTATATDSAEAEAQAVEGFEEAASSNRSSSTATATDSAEAQAVEGFEEAASSSRSSSTATATDSAEAEAKAVEGVEEAASSSRSGSTATATDSAEALAANLAHEDQDTRSEAAEALGTLAEKGEREVIQASIPDMFGDVMVEVEVPQSQGRDGSVPLWKKWKAGTFACLALDGEMREQELMSLKEPGGGAAENVWTGKRPAPEGAGDDCEGMLAKAYRGGA